MLRNLKSLLISVITYIRSIMKNGFRASRGEAKSIGISTDIIEIEIIGEDIINGIPNTPDKSVISRALKRNGINAIVTDYCIILEDSSIYQAENFSDHWKAYIGSEKIKPKKINYILSSNN